MKEKELDIFKIIDEKCKVSSLTKGLSQMLIDNEKEAPIQFRGAIYHPKCLAKKLGMTVEELLSFKKNSPSHFQKLSFENCSQTILIEATTELNFDTKNWYKGTKPVFLRINNKGRGDGEPLFPTTWAALLRKTIEYLQVDINHTENFVEKFNNIMTDIFKKNGFQFNNNFSPTLFEDDSFITSTVYRNNQNHKLEVCKGKYICAVYTSEVIAVINGIVKAIGGDCKVTIDYVIRESNFMDGVTNLTKELNDLINSVPEGNKKEVRQEVIRTLKEKLEGQYVDEDGFKYVVEVHEEKKDRIINGKDYDDMIVAIRKFKEEICLLECILENLSLRED